MEISQKLHVSFHEVGVVDLCMNVWVCAAFPLKLCLMSEVTELCQSVRHRAHLWLSVCFNY